MNVIYAYKHNAGEYLHFPALIHSVNSVRKYCTDLDDIIIASVLHPLVLGIRGVIWVPLTEAEAEGAIQKEINIKHALLRAIAFRGIGEFLWMQDDTFAVNEFSCEDCRTFTSVGKLSEHTNQSDFAALLNKTRERLGDVDNLCAHVPVVMNSEHFIESASAYVDCQIETAYAAVAKPDIADRGDGTFINVGEGEINPTFIKNMMRLIYRGET